MKLRAFGFKLAKSTQKWEKFQRFFIPPSRPKIPPQDVKNRWSSTYLLLSGSIEVREQIDAMTATDADLANLCLSPTEWSAAKGWEGFLKVS